MQLSRGYRQLMDEAKVRVRTYAEAQVVPMTSGPAAQIVGIRDICNWAAPNEALKTQRARRSVK